MNKEEAISASNIWFWTIDKAVEYLQECKKRGENVYLDFNGNTLYSCDVTLDSAYIQIIGLTKEESNKAQEELSEAYKDKEKRKEIIEKYSKMKQGHIEEIKENITQDKCLEIDEYRDTLFKKVINKILKVFKRNNYNNESVDV